MIGQILAIIPARGGSKSIPRKNIAPLAGRPLISYVIEAAKRSRHVNRITVSTDSGEIAEASRSAGAEVPFLRPAEFAENGSSVMDALYHAVSWLDKNENYRPEILAMLQPTSPFLRADQIDKAIEILQSQPDADAVTSIVEVPHVFHPYNIRVLDEDGSVRFFMPKEHERFPDRQSKPKFYAFGNLYVFRYHTLVTQRSLYGKRCLGLVIDSLSAFDVNEPQDLAAAECLLKGLAP